MRFHRTPELLSAIVLALIFSVAFSASAQTPENTTPVESATSENTPSGPAAQTEATPSDSSENAPQEPQTGTSPEAASANTPAENNSDTTGQPAGAEPAADQSDAESAAETAAENSEATQTKPAPEPENQETHQRESTEVVFRLSQKDKQEIDALAAEYVKLSIEKDFLEARQSYYQSEIDKLTQAAGGSSGVSLFLADFGSFSRQRKPAAKNVGIMLTEELTPLSEAMLSNQKRLKSRVDQLQLGWEQMRQVRWENEALQYELETGAKIVAQAASLLSMDKRWFWLGGLIAFTVLLAAVLLDKRHEIRRWLCGGRARKMRLTKVLIGFIIFLGIATFITFLYGDRIYRALLDVSVKGVPPKTEFARKIELLKKEIEPLQSKADEQTVELRNARKALQKPFKDAIPKEEDVFIGEQLYKVVSDYRAAVINNAIYAHQIESITNTFKEDRSVMDSLYSANQKFGKQAARFLRIKHLFRAGLGIVLLGLLMLGLYSFFRGIVLNKAKIRNTCPECLTEGDLMVLSTPEDYAQACQKYHLDPQSVPSPEPGNATVWCRHEISAKPLKYCNFAFGGKYQKLPKLSIPTLGVPQAGKTFWLTMLYWQLQKGYSQQSKDMSIVPSPAVRDLDIAVNELVEQRHVLPATQRDRVPYPIMFDYTDHDPLGKTRLLTSVFDYSGEITTDVAAEDYRRKRALSSDAFLFFLDPTYPWQPQAEALERFNSDLRTEKQIKQWRSLRLPIALCITKIDLLPTISDWDDAWHKAERFYTDMEKIDPTGEAISRSIIDQRSALTDALRKDLWPDWDLDGQIKKLFGGRHLFFPMTSVGLEGSGETDLSARTLSPFGLAEPLFWIMEMNGYPTL